MARRVRDAGCDAQQPIVRARRRPLQRPRCTKNVKRRTEIRAILCDFLFAQRWCAHDAHRSAPGPRPEMI